mmetsp:Transcript_4002/g.11571  ORF Transcript_4002/g.11571 Transcript_4002/m.11571 type:complete len:156 (-) Transcript_4002:9-476(-)
MPALVRSPATVIGHAPGRAGRKDFWGLYAADFGEEDLSPLTQRCAYRWVGVHAQRQRAAGRASAWLSQVSPLVRQAGGAVTPGTREVSSRLGAATPESAAPRAPAVAAKERRAPVLLVVEPRICPRGRRRHVDALGALRPPAPTAERRLSQFPPV